MKMKPQIPDQYCVLKMATGEIVILDVVIGLDKNKKPVSAYLNTQNGEELIEINHENSVVTSNTGPGHTKTFLIVDENSFSNINEQEIGVCTEEIFDLENRIQPVIFRIANPEIIVKKLIV